jgi:hypothetical protein
VKTRQTQTHSDSEIHTLALFRQLRGVRSKRSFLGDAQRYFAHLFSGIAGLHPSSLHRRVRKLRRFLEPLRRTVLPESTGEPETPIADALGRAAPTSSFAVGRLRRCCVGEVGIVRPSEGEATPPLLDQPRAPFLRTDRGQRRGRLIERGTPRRGGSGRGSSWESWPTEARI